MLNVRLPQELENRVKRAAAAAKRTKTQVVREALESYLGSQENLKTSYELGEDLFGKYGSGRGDLSTTYKSKLKERLRAKHAR